MTAGQASGLSSLCLRRSCVDKSIPLQLN